MPKEMLPLVDKPVIQYVVEELVSVGIEDIVMVTGTGKRSIEDHFDKPGEDLVANLRMGGKNKEHLLEEITQISEMANFIYVRQKGPYGNGTPLLNVEHLIGDEPFIYTWSDDFFVAHPPRFQQMIDIYNAEGCSVLSAISATNNNDYDRYGFVGGNVIREGLIDVRTIIEKPGKKNAPSSMATVSGYILTPDVFKYLHEAVDNLAPGEEFYSNDALKKMLVDKIKIVAYEIQNARYYDAGNKLEYLKTVVDFALKHDDIKEDFLEYLKKIIL
ncbi:MAG: UTP--glucose-1-phosphate uridylyltransferase GalU [Candidatus Saccharimonadales bacterium]